MKKVIYFSKSFYHVDKELEVSWEDEIQEIKGIKAEDYRPPQNKINEKGGPILINNTEYGIVGEEIIEDTLIISAY